MKAIFIFLSTLNLCSYLLGQTPEIHQSEVITNFPTKTPSTLPATPVVTNSASIIYRAEDEIVLKPESTVVNEQPVMQLEVKASGTNYFLALISPGMYAELKDKLDASFVLVYNKVLKFKYEELYAVNHTLDFKIYDYKRTLMNIPVSYTVNKLGANYVSIDLSQTSMATLASSDEQNYYILEVKNAKGDLKLVRFKIN